MNILVLHGYLLTETGSNLYVTNLVREFCRNGHNVILLCQDYSPEKQDYIEEVYVFDKSNKKPELIHHKDTIYPGKCTFFKTDIGGLLPVYVLDHYNGFRVKIFPDCTNNEINFYVDQYVNVLLWILNKFSIDIIQTNHMIMFPYIVFKTFCIGKVKYCHFCTIHGSALNFSVKKDNRFILFAKKGLQTARAVFVDSQHARNELIQFAEKNSMKFLEKKISVIPAGVDISRFDILSIPKQEKINLFIDQVELSQSQKKGRTIEQSKRILFDQLPETEEKIEKLIKETKSSYDYRFIDQDVIKKISSINWPEENIIFFVGKYLWTKGIYLILLAIPLILEKYPDTKFVFIGFGPFREIAELIVNCLSKNLLYLLEKLIKSKTPLLSNDDYNCLPYLNESLRKHKKRIKRSLNIVGDRISRSVVFTGILDHEELKHLLPCADILIAPSVFSEAFGMVAIEALASGVYPIVTYQSAFKEITDEMAKHLDGFDLKIEYIHLNEDMVIKIFNNVDNFLRFKNKLVLKNRLGEFKNRLRNISVRKYSWQIIATKYLEHYKKLA